MYYMHLSIMSIIIYTIVIINNYHIYDDYSAQVQNKMIEFDKNGVPQWDFNGKALLKGELTCGTPIYMIISLKII